MTDLPAILQGWTPYGPEDPFENRAGPFYYQETESGIRCAFLAERRHCNSSMIVHGGMLMTFADLALWQFGKFASPDGRTVTASFNSEFLSAAEIGELVIAEGEAVKSGRSLVFVRGLVTTSERPVLNFSGILKKVR